MIQRSMQAIKEQSKKERKNERKNKIEIIPPQVDTLMLMSTAPNPEHGHIHNTVLKNMDKMID